MQRRIIANKETNAEQILRKTVPNSAHSKYSIIMNSENHPRLNAINNILAHRKKLWVTGTIDDVKMGDYFMYCKEYKSKKVLQYGMRDPNIYDFLDEQTRWGWSCGLEMPIHIEANGKHFLFGDNHNLALPFVAEMINTGITKIESTMVHIDAHSDHDKNKDFNIGLYLKLTKNEKLQYVYRKAAIGSWIQPLLNQGYINNEIYRFFNSYDNLANYKDVHYNITDIDIDVLAELLFVNNMDIESAAVAKKVSEIIDIASHSKIVMLFTSPCYINQKHAIQLGKKIFNGILEKSQ